MTLNTAEKLLPWFVNWATLLKEICDAGSVYGKRVTELQKPFAVTPGTLMSKNRDLLNIILTTAAAWRACFVITMMTAPVLPA